jgi:hypothetical protein
MQVKDAVKIAIAHIKDLFASESVSNVGLEEAEFEESTNAWAITVGFSRPWDYPKGIAALVDGASQPFKRSYKVVRVSDPDGAILSVKDRFGLAA